MGQKPIIVQWGMCGPEQGRGKQRATRLAETEAPGALEDKATAKWPGGGHGRAARANMGSECRGRGDASTNALGRD